MELKGFEASPSPKGKKAFKLHSQQSLTSVSEAGRVKIEDFERSQGPKIKDFGCWLWS